MSEPRTVLSDRDVVRRCRGGDEGAWAILVERFGPYVWAIARHGYRLDDATAEDIFQEAFARAYQHLGRVRDDDAFRAWIGQTTRRLAVDHIRGTRREDLVGDAPEAVETDVRLERLAEAMTVRMAVEDLSPACRQIIDRFFVRDESYELIGRSLDLPAGTIASRISRCLAKLRETLA